MKPKENCFCFAVGEKGSGKTTFLRRCIERTPRLLVADATGDYDTLDNIHTTDNAADAARLFERAAGRPCRVRLVASLAGAGLSAYRAREHAGSDARLLGLRAAAVAWAATDVTLVLDELALYCTATVTPPVLAQLASYGRHRRVNLLATTRRPAEISRLLTSQSDFSVFFRLTEPRDLQYAAQRLGPAAKRLPALGIGRALYVGDATKLRLLSLPRLPAGIGKA